MLALGVWTGVLAQQQAPPSAEAASSVRRDTAPTSPTTQLIQDARSSRKDGREDVATPQMAVPLGRTAQKPVALKPGRPEQPKGGVDETAARCQAEKASGPHAKCATP